MEPFCRDAIPRVLCYPDYFCRDEIPRVYSPQKINKKDVRYRVSTRNKKNRVSPVFTKTLYDVPFDVNLLGLMI